LEIRSLYLNELEARRGGARDYLQRADAGGRFKLIVAVGSAAGALVYANVKRTPVVFSMVSVPRALDASGSRLCGVSMHIPAEEYFVALRGIAPDARRIHAFYSSDRGDYLTAEGEYSDLRN